MFLGNIELVECELWKLSEWCHFCANERRSCHARMKALQEVLLKITGVSDTSMATYWVILIDDTFSRDEKDVKKNNPMVLFKIQVIYGL